MPTLMNISDEHSPAPTSHTSHTSPHSPGGPQQRPLGLPGFMPTLMNSSGFILSLPHTFHIFPHPPGGPYSSTPFGGLMPTLMNSSGFMSGSSIDSLSSLICSDRPPI